MPRTYIQLRYNDKQGKVSDKLEANKVRVPSGACLAEEGVLEYPDGSKLLLDGTLELADGSDVDFVSATNGLLPDGTKQGSGGAITFPSGAKALADGTLLDQNGSKMTPLWPVPLFQTSEDKKRARGQGSATPLHEAVKAADLARVRQLLKEGGGQVNMPDESGCTPLHHASDIRIVEELVRNGARPNICNEEGESAKQKWSSKDDQQVIYSAQQDYVGRTTVEGDSNVRNSSSILARTSLVFF